MKSLIIIALLIPSLLLAEGADEKLPASGVLSSATEGGMGGTDVNIPWGSKYNQAPPIAGSVSKLSERELSVKLFNNTESTYAVTVAVLQFKSGGAVLKTDIYSYTIKGKGSVERTVPGSPLTVASRLELRSWKDLTPKKAEEAAVSSSSAAPAPAAAPAVAPAADSGEAEFAPPKRTGSRSFSPKPPGPAIE